MYIDTFVSMQRILDNFGLTISAACAIHCILLPVLLILSPYIELAFITSHEFHETLMYFILPTSLVAFAMGCRKHKDYRVALLAVTGITILLYATLHHESLHGVLELVTLTGSLFLVVSHFTNFILCQKAGCIHKNN